MELGRVKYTGPATYEIVNQETGSKYIGSTSNMRQRYYQHLTALKNECHKNINLLQAYNTDKDNLKLIIHKKETTEQAIDYENLLLNEYKDSPLLMNINKAENRHADETKRKISKTLTGFNRSEENKNNISKGKLGKTFTEEHKRNISMGKGLPVIVNGIEYRNTNIAARTLNVPSSQILILARGETIRPAKRKVEINGIIYESLVDARNILNLTKKQLERRLNSDSDKYKNFKRL